MPTGPCVQSGGPAPAGLAAGAEPSSRARTSRLATLRDEPPLRTRTATVRHRRLGQGQADSPADYGLQAVIGTGGMGVVWEARQAGLDRLVAIKRVKAGAGARAAEQLLAEAELTGSLEHPGIVPVHEVGVDQDGVPFYAMRRLRGRTWSEQWTDLRQREHLDILLRVCDAVAYAHGRGVIHRDLKPANVFLGDYGEVVVFDWGLAARLDDLRAGDRRILASGTPVYMAPEMARADAAQLGPASDIYLLGAILYEILTGLAPHPGEEVVDIMMAAADNHIDPPIPEGELGEVARRAMAAEPDQRFPDVRAFQAALRTCREHQESMELSERAQVRLRSAGAIGTYDAFARSVHAFEDALELWPMNRSARAGLAQARLAFATRARLAGDLDLAGSLLLPDEPAHGEELVRLGIVRDHRHRRQRVVQILRWTSGILLVVLVASLLAGFLAVSHQRNLILRISHERDAAESALEHAERAEVAGRQRAWRRVVQEDFAHASLPPMSRVVSGRWGITDSTLVAEGTSPASLAVPIPPSKTVVVQVDLDPGGRLGVRLGGAAGAAGDSAAGDGLTVSMDGRVMVSRDGVMQAMAPLGEAAQGLSRRLRIELDGKRLRIFVDGRPAIDLPQGEVQRIERIALVADPGSVLDNLKVEVPWE